MSRQLIRHVAVVLVLGLSIGFATISLRANKSAPARIEGPQGAGTRQAQPFDQSQKLADLAKRIAGQEDKPAAEVFKNVQLLKAMPAKEDRREEKESRVTFVCKN